MIFAFKFGKNMKARVINRHGERERRGRGREKERERREI